MAEFTCVPPAKELNVEQAVNIKEEPTGDTGWQQDEQETYNEDQETYDYFGLSEPTGHHWNETYNSCEQSADTRWQQETCDVNFPQPDNTSTSQVQESRDNKGRHLVKNTDEKPYMCVECGYSTANKAHLSRHRRTHTGEKPYKCDQCDYSAADKTTFDRHLAKHSGEKRYICEECGYKTARKSHLSQHVRTHTGERPYKCDQCNFSASKKCNLNEHLSKKHSGKKPYLCRECGYKTAYKSALSQHMRKHTGEKPYKCDQCDYAAAQKSNLDQHLVKHFGEKKPNMCRVQKDLSQHITTHIEQGET
ncbi:gastrula zinc finger protein XlCGF7.1-like [Branchiostoma floridae]|uniref:Gastrula zinc finger protein XlCGF7.1-like n=1 Tax=Branchiostoma floridae TaxID=7739 RepID=A0A9J7HFG5_BRAFL|nr:gastrula zinc finger protein XlCGF7.1-like [Branchiostoma floridae]